MNTDQAREILKKVRAIEIRTNRLVNDSLAGQYHSVFKGRGMDFDEVREYTPGDEVRTIDWNVTARTGHPFIKKFTEERELTIMLLVDVSASGNFGSGAQSKRQMAAELASVLAFSAIRNSDKVGLILFSDQIEQYIPPKKGRQHVLRVIREVLCFEPQSRGTDIVRALDFANQITSRRAILFVVSDFEFPDPERSLADLRRAVRLAGRRHDVVALHVHDRREGELPDVGQLTIEDAESGELVEINTADPWVRQRFAELAQARGENLRHTLASEGVDSLNLDTRESFEPALRAFFKNRQRRLRVS
ncbi:MAG TPA: DUF58 domain-containing protein [Candidatus Acidoferrum sp.]|nr:DUF58 domain-containing protein [Candidatus Acidoferrum sp.]